MDGHKLSTAEAQAVVEAELMALLYRCEAAGVNRDMASELLKDMVFREALSEYMEDRRGRDAAAAQTPAGAALQKAFELHQRQEQLRRMGCTPVADSEFDAACAEYLRLAHGVVPGDTIEIHGWTKPRVLRLKAFRLSFRDKATDAFMWFDGDPVRNCPRNRASSEHGCSLTTYVCKV